MSRLATISPATVSSPNRAAKSIPRSRSSVLIPATMALITPRSSEAARRSAPWATSRTPAAATVSLNLAARPEAARASIPRVTSLAPAANAAWLASAISLAAINVSSPWNTWSAPTSAAASPRASTSAAVPRRSRLYRLTLSPCACSTSVFFFSAISPLSIYSVVQLARAAMAPVPGVSTPVPSGEKNPVAGQADQLCKQMHRPRRLWLPSLTRVAC